MGRIVRVSWVAVVASLALTACATEEELDGESDHTSEAPLVFDAPVAVYEWVAAEAERARLADVVVDCDGTGHVSGVTMGPSGRDRILSALQGRAGYFKVAGQPITLPVDGVAGAATELSVEGGEVETRESAITSRHPEFRPMVQRDVLPQRWFAEHPHRDPGYRVSRSRRIDG